MQLLNFMSLYSLEFKKILESLFNASLLLLSKLITSITKLHSFLLRDIDVFEIVTLVLIFAIHLLPIYSLSSN